MNESDVCERLTGKTLPWYISRNSTIKTRLGCEVAEKLPHGSGINSDWHLTETKDKIYAFNSYDTMDEHGFYGPSVNFTVAMPKRNLKDLRLSFGKGSHYWVQKYALRDYLEDQISFSLEE